MENKEMNKLNTEELDQVAGGGLDNIIDTVADTLKKGADYVDKGIEAVKVTAGTAVDAGKAALQKAADTVVNSIGISTSLPVQKYEDDSYHFGE